MWSWETCYLGNNSLTGGVVWWNCLGREGTEGLFLCAFGLSVRLSVCAVPFVLPFNLRSVQGGAPRSI